jgi:hypothetical protein
MPIFLRPSSEAVRVESGRAMFPRGRRRPVPTNRRIRDTVCLMLAGLGVESTEIAKIMASVSGRQVRNILPRGAITTQTRMARG